MLHKKKIVVVLPAYQAEKTLERSYQDIPKDIVDQIIMVDFFSSDRTVEVAHRLGI
jgi:glycosyltransferase involved in cell wall biosynthesis